MLGLHPFYRHKYRIESFHQICQQQVRIGERTFNVLTRILEIEHEIPAILVEAQSPEHITAGDSPETQKKIRDLLYEQLNLYEEGIDLFLLTLVNCDSLIWRTDNIYRHTLSHMKKRETKLMRKLKTRYLWIDVPKEKREEFISELQNADSDLRQKMLAAYKTTISVVTKILDAEVLDIKSLERGVPNLQLLLEGIDPRGYSIIAKRIKSESISLPHFIEELESLTKIDDLEQAMTDFQDAQSRIHDIQHKDAYLTHHLEVALGHTGAIIKGNLKDDVKLNHRFDEVHSYFEKVLLRGLIVAKRAQRDIVAHAELAQEEIPGVIVKRREIERTLRRDAQKAENEKRRQEKQSKKAAEIVKKQVKEEKANNKEQSKGGKVVKGDYRKEKMNDDIKQVA